MTIRRTATLVTAAAVTLVLSGCLPTQAPTPTPDTETAVETEAPVETPADAEEPTEEPAPADGEATAPGTELAFGEPATVSWNWGGTDAVDQLISISVTGVREGAIEDFAGLDQEFLDQLDGYQTYYVDIETTKLEPATEELAFSSIYTDFGAVDSTGASMSPVSIIGEFSQCDASSFGEEIDTGETVQTCVIVAATDDVEFGAATFEPYDSAYDPYDGSPLLWS